MKTIELKGAALDWAVMKAEGPDSFAATVYYDGDTPLCIDDQCDVPEIWSPSTDWSQGGPIIEREGINLDNYAKSPQWSAWTPAPERKSGEAQAYGPTPLIAAMRCYVASKLGDEINFLSEAKK
jgi:hypothetical protein